jgi:hypothetical protein
MNEMRFYSLQLASNLTPSSMVRMMGRGNFPLLVFGQVLSSRWIRNAVCCERSDQLDGIRRNSGCPVREN